MAIYHFSASIVKRSGGRSAVAGAAYISGTSIREERTGLTHDYRRRRGVVQTDIITPTSAPDWMHDRATLWNRVEQGEKRLDAQLARSIRLALPHELTDEQRADLVFEYVREMFVSQGMIADIAIHRPDRHGDKRNHHAHILLTMREIEGEGFARKKQRDWNDDQLLDHWREEWATYVNRALEEAGSEARVDHRTLVAQGIERHPTIHVGKAASALERKGIATERGDWNREVEESNRHIEQLTREIAALEAERAELLAREQAEEAVDIELEEAPHSLYALPIAQEPSAPQTVLWGEEEVPMSWENVQAWRQSAFASEVTRAYREEESPTVESEQEPAAQMLVQDGQQTRPQQSASAQDIIQAYGGQPVSEQEQRELARRWYEAIWNGLPAKARAVVNAFWQGYVQTHNKNEPEHERDGPEPER